MREEGEGGEVESAPRRFRDTFLGLVVSLSVAFLFALFY